MLRIKNPDILKDRLLKTDGVSWAEGPLRHPALSHICISHPIHAICTHHPFSIPDLLRINVFNTTVTLTIDHTVFPLMMEKV